MSNKLKIFLVFLILTTIGTGFYSRKIDEKSKVIKHISTPKLEIKNPTEINTTIFIPNFKQGNLFSEEITINSTITNKEEILKSIIENLLNKLEQKKLLKKESFKYEVYIKNRTLYLDLDSRIFSSAKTAQDELLLIYSFVNSLLTPGGADNLVLLINGSTAEKINFININKSYKLNKNI